MEFSVGVGSASVLMKKTALKIAHVSLTRTRVQFIDVNLDGSKNLMTPRNLHQKSHKFQELETGNVHVTPAAMGARGQGNVGTCPLLHEKWQ